MAVYQKNSPAIGLIIQGPLSSVGRTGNYEGHTTFDCRANITRIIATYGHLFKNIVIITWKEEVRSDDVFPGATLLPIVDETPPDYFPVDDPGSKNKYRQYLSSYKGAEYLRQQDETPYTVRMRSDFFLDLETLVAFLVSHPKRGTRVFTPAIRTDYYLLDFYFAGKTNTLLNFFNAMICDDYAEFAQSAHQEPIIKYAYHYFKNRLALPREAYYIKNVGKPSVPTRDIIRWMLNNAFHPLPRKVFETLEWRGERTTPNALQRQKQRLIFAEDTQNPFRYFSPRYRVRYLCRKTWGFLRPRARLRALRESVQKVME